MVQLQEDKAIKLWRLDVKQKLAFEESAIKAFRPVVIKSQEQINLQDANQKVAVTIDSKQLASLDSLT